MNLEQRKSAEELLALCKECAGAGSITKLSRRMADWIAEQLEAEKPAAIPKNVAEALMFSRNFAEVSTALTNTAKMHIKGLADLLEAAYSNRAAALKALDDALFALDRLASSQPPSAQVDDLAGLDSYLRCEATDLARQQGREDVNSRCLRRWADAVKKIRASLATQQSEPQRVPEGWQFVPKYPTPEMLLAGEIALDNGIQGELDCLYCWEAMLAAAPTPPATQPQAAPQAQDSEVKK